MHGRRINLSPIAISKRAESLIEIRARAGVDAAQPPQIRRVVRRQSFVPSLAHLRARLDIPRRCISVIRAHLARARERAHESRRRAPRRQLARARAEFYAIFLTPSSHASARVARAPARAKSSHAPVRTPTAPRTWARAPRRRRATARPPARSPTNSVP